MIEQAVILAAGRGTRLGPLTQHRPKSMLPILGKPIVAHVLDHMVEAGVRRFVVVVGTDDGGMSRYLREGWRDDVEVRFAVQERATGTVDALTLAAPHVDGPFLLSAVDNITSPEHVKRLVARFADCPEQIATLSLLPATPEQIRRSSDVVIEGDWITAIEEKPAEPRSRWAAIMLYAFSLRYLDYLAGVPVSVRGEREIVSGIQAGIADGGRVGYVTTEHRLHLTRETDLLAINLGLLSENGAGQILSPVPESVQLIPPLRIDPGVRVGEGARLGPHVYLESGAEIGAGAAVAETLVLAGGVIPAGESSQGEIIEPGGRHAVAPPSE